MLPHTNGRSSMKRRNFIHSALAAGVAAGAPAGAAPEGAPQYLRLTWFRSRRDLDLERLRGFLGNTVVPALGRARVSPVGAFQVSVGPENPSILIVSPFASLAAFEESWRKVAADDQYARGRDAFDEKWDLAYDHVEESLLRGFRTFPGIELPKPQAGKANLFELRIYESRRFGAHTRKAAMSDGGEIAIFRRVGINPVFFGTTLFGPRVPSLTYMVYYPTWEARAEAWSKFGGDPEWKKLSTAPGNTDRELVTKISNQLLQPLPFSEIK